MKSKTHKIVVAGVANPDIVKKRQSQIVATASELFSKKGYHATSMRDIAAASGINLSYLYKYISTKDDILYLFYIQLYKEWDSLHQDLIKIVDKDPVEQLKEWVSSMIDILSIFRNEVLTMYTESRHLGPDSMKAVLSKESGVVRALEQLIIRGVKKGAFHTNDTFLAANTILFLVSIGPLRGWNFRNRYKPEQIKAYITNVVFAILGIDENDKQ